MRPTDPKQTDNWRAVNSIASGWYMHDPEGRRSCLHVDDRWMRVPQIHSAMGLPPQCDKGDPSDGTWRLDNAIVEVRSVAHKWPCTRLIRILEFGPTEAPAGA